MKILILLLLASCVTTPIKKPVELPPAHEEYHDILYSNLDIDWVKEAIKTANCVMNLKAFQDEIKSIEHFDYTDDNGKQVLENLLKVRVKVVLYTPKWPWSKAVAYTQRDINLNTRRNPRELSSMVNTLSHEATHKANYSHGDNSSIGKENSVGYGLGSIAARYTGACK